MSRPARGLDRPPRSWRSRLVRPRLTKRRAIGAAALAVVLIAPAGVFGEAYTSFYGLDAYTTYADPYTGASTHTVRPFWDVLGVFQRPVSAGPPLTTAAFSPAGVARSSGYAPYVTTAGYYGGGSFAPATSYYGNAPYGNASYYGGTSFGGSSVYYDDASAYYGGAVSGTQSGGGFGSSCGTSYFDFGDAGGGLSYGTARGFATSGDGCGVPACSPCSDPCGGGCAGGNCTSYSVPDERVIESDPVFADPPSDSTTRRRQPERSDRDFSDRDIPDRSRFDPVPATRDRTDRDRRDLLDPPAMEDRPAPRRPSSGDSVRDPIRDDFPDEDFSGGGFPGGGFSEDDRPTGSAYDDPLEEDFGGGLGEPGVRVDPAFPEGPGDRLLPAGGEAPYVRQPDGVVDPPGEPARPVRRRDEAFPAFDRTDDGAFDGAAPPSSSTGNFGSNPGGVGRVDRSDESFAPDPDMLGGPGDGAFGGLLDERPAADDGFFPGDAPGAGRESFRLRPAPVSPSGPPGPEEDGAAVAPPGDDPVDLVPTDLVPTDLVPTDATSEEPGLPDDGAAGGQEDVSEPPATDAAAAFPRLITAELLRNSRSRTRLRSRLGRTHIARFRHRAVDPPAPATTPDVKLATK